MPKKQKTPLATMQEDAKSIAGPGKDVKKTFSVKLGKEKFGMEEFCNYKSLLALEIIGELSEKIDLAPLVTALMAMAGGENRVYAWAHAASRILPRLLKSAPKELLRLAALSLIPNAKLMELYDTPNAIPDEITRLEKLIAFEGEQGLPIVVIKEALPYMGLEVLKNEIEGLGGQLNLELGEPEALDTGSPEPMPSS